MHNFHAFVAIKISTLQDTYARLILCKHLHVSQAEFAEAMETSVNTIKSWETKHRNPPGLAAKVLATIQDNPAFFNELASH